jgi:hypothetical protein
VEKTAGIALIIGSLLFVIAAFMPITIRVVTAPNPRQLAEFIQNDRMGWLFVNILFGVGSIVAVLGLSLFSLHVQSISGRLISYLGAAAAAFGSLLWVIIVYNRAVLPAEALGSDLSVNSWMFPVYTVLMQIGLMIIGFVLIQSGYPGWLSWGMLAVGGLSLLAFLFFKDMPPFAHYVPLLILGITLLR